MRDVQTIDEATERWCVIADWPDYAVSDHGRVKRITDWRHARAGRVRKPVFLSGYPAVALTARPGRRKMRTIHSLVAEAFLPPKPFPEAEVNHKDADRANPHWTNLEWVSRSANRQHGYDVGFCDARGDRNGNARLCSEDVRAIRAEPDRSGWPGLAARFGVSVATIRDVATRRTWTHV